MKIKNIIKGIENLEPAAFEQTEDRRSILKSFGAKIAAAAIPVIALSSKKSSAKTTDVLAESIVFALGITLMQEKFYLLATTQNVPWPPEVEANIKKIYKDKQAQNKYWTDVLVATGNTVPAPLSYNFALHNQLNDVFTNYSSFLLVAQVLEDVGVRMYGTAVLGLVTNKALRGDAINMRSANARHAAHIRLLRRNAGVDMMPWITGNNANTVIGEVIKGYQGEDNTMQGIYNITNLNGAKISFNAATEAFDEPMEKAEAELFIQGFTT
ncbi:MAG: ferritin-like domain-containing protein [Bacteroidetes bacterium]|nr:ferritin-like domain-containing protein [Bacteroidota bacterium]